MGCNHIIEDVIWIDGYNVLITLETMLDGKPLFLCDDYFLRDIRGVFRGFKIGSKTKHALELMVSYLGRYPPSEIHILLDSRISKSGELAGNLRTLLKREGLPTDVILSTCVDFELKKKNEGIVATADGAIIDCVKRVIDLPACIWLENYRMNIQPERIKGR